MCSDPRQLIAAGRVGARAMRAGQKCIAVLAYLTIVAASASAQEIIELPIIGDALSALASKRGVAVREGWTETFPNAPTDASFTSYSAEIGAIPFRAQVFGVKNDVVAAAFLFDDTEFRARRGAAASVEDCYLAFSVLFRMMTLAHGQPDLPPKEVGSNNLGQATFTLPGLRQGVLFGSFEAADCTVVAFYGNAPALQVIAQDIR